MVLGEKRQDVNGNMDQGCESKNHFRRYSDRMPEKYRKSINENWKTPTKPLFIGLHRHFRKKFKKNQKNC